MALQLFSTHFWINFVLAITMQWFITLWIGVIRPQNWKLPLKWMGWALIPAFIGESWALMLPPISALIGGNINAQDSPINAGIKAQPIHFSGNFQFCGRMTPIHSVINHCIVMANTKFIQKWVLNSCNAIDSPSYDFKCF